MESNTAVSSSGKDDEDDVTMSTSSSPKQSTRSDTIYASYLSKEEAARNLEYLNTQAKSWLAVLFNVFTSVERDGRAMVGDVISVWAGIANEPVCSRSLVVSLFWILIIHAFRN